MSLVADEQDNWRGSYDAWKAHDPRNDDGEQVDHSPKRCTVCGELVPARNGVSARCHTAQERDAAYRARMGW